MIPTEWSWDKFLSTLLSEIPGSQKLNPSNVSGRLIKSAACILKLVNHRYSYSFTGRWLSQIDW